MRTAAGILTILGGFIGGTFWSGFIRDGLISIFINTQPSSDPASTAHILAILIYLVCYLPIFLAMTGGYHALKRKHWKWALLGAIYSLLFPFFGIPAVILMLKSKSEFQG